MKTEKLACPAGRAGFIVGLYSGRMTNDGSWELSLREGRFADAAARARLGGAPPNVAGALEDLAEVQRGVKDKRYGAARRALNRYRDSLQDVQDANVGAFVNAEALGRALEALESAEQARHSDVGELREHLAPAFAHRLTEAEAHNSVGVLHALSGEGDAARAAFDRALTLDPAHHRALTNIGNVLLEGGDPQGAEGYYRRALELNPDYPGAHHNLAVALRRQRKVAASVRALKTGQRLAARHAGRESREEARERFGQLGAGAGKWLRLALIVVAVLVALYALRGGL